MAKTTVKEAIERLDRELRRVLAENSEKMAQYYRGEIVEPECLGSMPELIEMNYMLETDDFTEDDKFMEHMIIIEVNSKPDTDVLKTGNRFIENMVLTLLTDEEEERYNYDKGYNDETNREILVPIIQKITGNIRGTRLDTSDFAVEAIQAGLACDIKVLADRDI